MKKFVYVIFILLVDICLEADSLRYLLHEDHAFVMPKGKKRVTLEYMLLNDTVDVFNIKKQELGNSLSKYGSIGDMTGYKASLVYGVSKDMLLGLGLKKQDIKYGNNTLSNFKYQLYGRYNFFQSTFKDKAMSVDMGVEGNSANKISYDDPKILEPLALKVLKDKDSTIKDVKILTNTDKTYSIGVLKKDGSTDILGGLVQKPTLYLDGMRDRTFFVRFLMEQKINDNFYISAFTKYNFTHIATKVFANPELVKRAKDKGYDLVRDLNRDETSINVGFNLSVGKEYITEFKYYYTRFFRDNSLGYINYNHVVDIDIVKPISRDKFIYVGAKVMYRQFNGEIPYLYNRYTQTTYDHKYGYVRVGFGYLF